MDPRMSLVTTNWSGLSLWVSSLWSLKYCVIWQQLSMSYCDKKYPLCDLSIYITNELTGNSWCSTMAFKDSICWACITGCQMSVFNYYFQWCGLWLKRTLVFFVCEYLLCNLLNTVVFLNGERFYPMVINMISQLTQIDNLASAAVVACPAACMQVHTHQSSEECVWGRCRSCGLW